MPFCKRRQNALQKTAFQRAKDGQSQRVLPSFASRPVTAWPAVMLKYDKHRPFAYPFRRLGCSNSKATLKHHTYAYHQTHTARSWEKAGRPAPAHGRIDGRRIGPRQVHRQRPRGRRAHAQRAARLNCRAALGQGQLSHIIHRGRHSLLGQQPGRIPLVAVQFRRAARKGRAIHNTCQLPRLQDRMRQCEP